MHVPKGAGTLWKGDGSAQPLQKVARVHDVVTLIRKELLLRSIGIGNPSLLLLFVNISNRPLKHAYMQVVTWTYPISLGLQFVNA